MLTHGVAPPNPVSSTSVVPVHHQIRLKGMKAEALARQQDVTLPLFGIPKGEYEKFGSTRTMYKQQQGHKLSAQTAVRRSIRIARRAKLGATT